jgi:hypothetical protein
MFYAWIVAWRVTVWPCFNCVLATSMFWFCTYRGLEACCTLLLLQCSLKMLDGGYNLHLHVGAKGVFESVRLKLKAK